MIDIEQIREYALQKLHVTEGFPFGDSTLVYKVNNKMFLLVSLDKIPMTINLKCEPDKAIEQREDCPEIILPGYHMNKKHWNTILVEGLQKNKLLELIDDSYNLVSKR